MAREDPTLNGSSALQRFERGNASRNTQWNNVQFLPGTATYTKYACTIHTSTYRNLKNRPTLESKPTPLF